jgi:hypothetical protein
VFVNTAVSCESISKQSIRAYLTAVDKADIRRHKRLVHARLRLRLGSGEVVNKFSGHTVSCDAVVVAKLVDVTTEVDVRVDPVIVMVGVTNIVLVDVSTTTDVVVGTLSNG